MNKCGDFRGFTQMFDSLSGAEVWQLDRPQELGERDVRLAPDQLLETRACSCTPVCTLRQVSGYMRVQSFLPQLFGDGRSRRHPEGVVTIVWRHDGGGRPQLERLSRFNTAVGFKLQQNTVLGNELGCSFVHQNSWKCLKSRIVNVGKISFPLKKNQKRLAAAIYHQKQSDGNNSIIHLNRQSWNKRHTDRISAVSKCYQVTVIRLK